jgi:hypothetical protein
MKKERTMIKVMAAAVKEASPRLSVVESPRIAEVVPFILINRNEDIGHAVMPDNQAGDVVPHQFLDGGIVFGMTSQDHKERNTNIALAAGIFAAAGTLAVAVGRVATPHVKDALSHRNHHQQATPAAV